MRYCSLHLSENMPDRYLTALPHYSCLGPNLHSSEILETLDEGDYQLLTGEPVPFKYTLPLPLLRMKKSPKLFLYGKDPGLEIVHRKARWKEIIQRELTGFLKHKRFKDIPMIERELRRKNRMKRLPTSVVLLSKLLEYDPDDQFDGFYNWYYNGGCLSHVVSQGNDFLLRPGGLKSNKLDAVPIKRGKNFYFKPDVPNITTFDFGDESPIYQIVADKENEYVGIRKGRNCKLVSVMENSDILRFRTVDECQSESSAYTSFDFDGINKGNYVTMDTDGVVCIKHVENGSSYLDKWNVPGCSGKSVDKWCCAQYGQNRDSVVCANRHYIRTYDVRAQNMNTMEFCCKSQPGMLEKCEELTCIVGGSPRSPHPLLYVVTHHSLLGMDLRFPRVCVQRWTHGMETVPSYASVACVDSGCGGKPLEVVVLRSQVTNELRAIVNHPSSETSSFPISNFFPVSLPSYSDVLKFGQWHGRLLDPVVQRRLSMVTVGMCCFESEGSVITCLSQNSTGDVFQQHLVPMAHENNLTAKHVVRCLKRWENSLPREKKPRKKLETVVRTDMKGLVKRVLEKPNNLVHISKNIREDWKISKRALFACSDMLAEKIREVWQLEDEWKSDEEEEDAAVPTQEPVDKVQQWLGASQQVFTSTPVALQGSQESAALSFKPLLLESQFSECDNNMSPATAIVQETKRRLAILESGRSKRRRVDGF